ncbi:MAG: Gfo/Idh/MocA family oxidoreductase [Verrucomicrobiota bacterium]|nr:Gfo/Idh/MocA family oxidoreductase [Verrucomicrobiota bacterium]
MKDVTIGIIGTAGFAEHHLNSLDAFAPEEKLVLSAACEVNPAFSDNLAKLAKKGVNAYTDCETMFKEEQGKLDFIIIPTSIQSHKPLAISAMQNGFNVLLEKPPTTTIQDIDKIIETSKSTGQFCAVAFQSVYNKDFRKIKELIASNTLGKLQSITGKLCWQRDFDYYSRNKWAGKTKVDNNWVMDGSISNPGAHYLNNMLILGTCGDKEVSLEEINAELYRANDIECEDTVCLKSVLTNGITVNYNTTLGAEVNQSPLLVLHFENGKIEWEVQKKVIVKPTNDEEYSFAFDASEKFIQHAMYKNLLDHFRNGDEIKCDISATRLFMLAINGTYESAQRVDKIPSEYLIVYKNERDKTAIKIHNINSIIDEAMQKGVLFSDLNVPWSKKKETFELKDYKFFPEKFIGV